MGTDCACGPEHAHFILVLCARQPPEYLPFFISLRFFAAYEKGQRTRKARTRNYHDSADIVLFLAWYAVRVREEEIRDMISLLFRVTPAPLWFCDTPAIVTDDLPIVIRLLEEVRRAARFVFDIDMIYM